MTAQTTADRTDRDGSPPATAYTVFSAHTGKVYACCVTVDVALGWIAPYGGRIEDLLALALCDSWRSHPDPRGIAVMRVS